MDGVWPALITGVLGLVGIWYATYSQRKRRETDTDVLIRKLDKRNAESIAEAERQRDEARAEVRAKDREIRRLNDLLIRRAGHDGRS